MIGLLWLHGYDSVLRSATVVMLKFADILRFLLRFCHYGCASWHRSAYHRSSTNRDPCGLEGKESPRQSSALLKINIVVVGV
jgi:hypothetical protein